MYTGAGRVLLVVVFRVEVVARGAADVLAGATAAFTVPAGFTAFDGAFATGAAGAVAGLAAGLAAAGAGVVGAAGFTVAAVDGAMTAGVVVAGAGLALDAAGTSGAEAVPWASGPHAARDMVSVAALVAPRATRATRAIFVFM